MSIRILVTGAGGPAAVSFMRAVAVDREVSLFAGDIDPYAAGLYLVDDGHRFLVPRGSDPDFVPAILALCERYNIHVLVPTVDTELLPVAHAVPKFAQIGTRVLVASLQTLAASLDKWRLLNVCEGACPVPHTVVLDDGFDVHNWRFPVLTKPRRGSGGRGVQVVTSPAGLDSIARDGEMLVQEYLPGAEYSVDVLADRAHHVLACVPRERLKVDSGVAVTARSFHNAELQQYAAAVAERIQLSYVGNVQFRRDADGVPKLLEVNVRFPGTMPLTVASGIDMPRLALDLVLERPLFQPIEDFRDLAVVRFWEDKFFDPHALAIMEQVT